MFAVYVLQPGSTACGVAVLIVDGRFRTMAGAMASAEAVGTPMTAVASAGLVAGPALTIIVAALQSFVSSTCSAAAAKEH